VKFSQCLALCGEAVTLMTVMECKNASLQQPSDGEQYTR
jgi:hypothetical protein